MGECLHGVHSESSLGVESLDDLVGLRKLVIFGHRELVAEDVLVYRRLVVVPGPFVDDLQNRMLDVDLCRRRDFNLPRWLVLKSNQIE